MNKKGNKFKTKKKNNLIKISIIYTISNVAIKGIAFITTPFFSRLMSKSDYGEFNSIASWASIISIIVTLNLCSSINRAKYDFANKIDEYNSTLLILGNIFTILCWLVIEFKIDLFCSFLSMEKRYLRSIMIYSMFSPSVQILLAKFRIYNEYKKVVVVTWITLCITTFLSLFCVIIFDDKLWGRILGTYLLAAAVYFIFWIYIVSKGKRFHIKYCKYSLNLALPLIPHELAGILLTSSDRIIINKICGSSDTALYSLSYTISMVLTVFLSSLNQAWIPWFFDKLNGKKYNEIKYSSMNYLLIFTLGTYGIMLLGPELVFTFGGKDYLEAKYIIPPVCYAILFQFVYTLYVNIEFYVKKTFLISIATLISTSANIVLNFLLIPFLGYQAAAYTTIMGYFLMVVFHYIVVNKISEYNKIFNIKYIVFLLFLSFLVMLLVLTTYRFILFRLALIVSYVCLLITFVLKKIKN